MIFVDTSYLLALAMSNDALHEVAIAWSNAVAGPLLTTEFVLLEFVNQLSAPRHRALASRIVKRMYEDESFRIVSASTRIFRAGLELHTERQDKSWSLTDCISLVAMREAGVNMALTHDVHFQQMGFRSLLRELP